MPTFRVTGPDGSVYNVTPPEGMNPSEDEVLAQVQAQHGGGTRTTPAPPSPAPVAATTPAPPPTGYQSVAAPVTKAVSGLADVATEPLVALSRIFQHGEPAGQVGRSYNPLDARNRADTNTRSAAAPNPLGTMLTPQTPLEAGAMAGTLGAGPLIGAGAKAAVPGMQALAKMPALGRIFGGAVGGEVGNQAEGGPTGKGAALGGGAAAGGEVLGKVLGKGARMLTGSKNAIANDYQSSVGKAIGDIVPELRGAKTGEDFLAMTRLARGTRLPPGMSQMRSGDEALGEMLDVAALNIKGAIGDKPLWLAKMPGMKGGAPAAELLDAVGRPIQGVQTVPVAEAKFDQAITMLRDLYSRGYTGRATNPAVAAMEPSAAKAAAEELKQEMLAELIRLDPSQGARQLFQTSQDKFAKGTEILRDVNKSLRLSPDRIELHEPTLQQTVADRLTPVSAKMGRQRVTEQEPGADLETWLSTIYRKGGVGKTIPSTGTGDFGDSFRRAYGQGQGGTPAGIAAVPKALMENAGARYTGRQPYTLPPVLQSILDVVLQRAGGQALDPR